MWVARDPARYAGHFVGNGSCALFVQRASGIGLTSTWRQGRRVRDGNVAPNTVIATFVDGRYANRSGGNAHAALFIHQRANGLMVWDQWVGRPVAERLIQFRGGQGRRVNDGCQYYVVET